MSRRFIPELDGLRAFAIFGVLLVHSNFALRTPWLEMLRSWGWIGVDLFFVISGYLITSILAGSKGQPHYYRNFYARRGLRIWPLYFALLLFVFVLSPRLGAWARQGVDLRLYPWPYYVFYIQNLVLSHLGSFALVITWSLCVEEQFYLVWPLVVNRCSRRSLERVLLIVLAAEPLLRWAMRVGHHTDYGFYTPCRLDALATGALAAIRPNWLKHGWIALPAAVWLLWHHEWVLVYTMLAIGFGWLVARLVQHPNQFFALPSLRFVGKVSYGIYINHTIMYSVFWGTPLYWATRNLPHANVLHLVGQVLLPLPVAAVMWYLFEQPLLRLKKHFADDAIRRPARPLVLAAEAGD
jgi:peptidoglycan/LPS O-acetylase OafA/YrhL